MIMYPALLKPSLIDLVAALDAGVKIEFRSMIGAMVIPQHGRNPTYQIYVANHVTHTEFGFEQQLPARDELEGVKRVLAHEFWHIWEEENGLPFLTDSSGNDLPKYAWRIELWAKEFVESGDFEKLIDSFLGHPQCLTTFEDSGPQDDFASPFKNYWESKVSGKNY